MSRVIGNRYELHFVALRGILRGQAAGAKITIIRIRAEGDDPYWLILCLPG